MEHPRDLEIWNRTGLLILMRVNERSVAMHTIVVFMLIMFLIIDRLRLKLLVASSTRMISMHGTFTNTSIGLLFLVWM